MELSSFVSEQKFGTSRVKFKVVNLGVMVNRGLQLVVLGVQIHDADGHGVYQIGDYLGLDSTIGFLFFGDLRKSGRDHVRSHVLSSACANRLIVAILNNGQFSSIEDHDDVGGREVELLVARASPVDLRKLTGLNVTKKK